MSFIDSSYFVDEISVPQAATEPSLARCIIKYEKDILKMLLGDELYYLLIADCTEGVPATQKYKDLVDGKVFTHTYKSREYTLKWDGLKETVTKRSLIAYYVYHEYVRGDISRLYGTGISIAPKGQDWERVNSTPKLNDIWERMRFLYGRLSPGLKLYYDRPLGVDELPGVFNIDPSAYNFLYANKTDYPEWVFTPQWINAL